MQNRVRVHHLLCIPLFQGYGYSDSFSRNMAEKICYLEEHGQEKVELLTEPDRICGGCPNLTVHHTCRDDLNHVKQKDEELRTMLGIHTGEVRTWVEWKKWFAHHMTKEIFDRSCEKCQWYKKELCSYEKWLDKIGK